MITNQHRKSLYANVNMYCFAFAYANNLSWIIEKFSGKLLQKKIYSHTAMTRIRVSARSKGRARERKNEKNNNTYTRQRGMPIAYIIFSCHRLLSTTANIECVNRHDELCMHDVIDWFCLFYKNICRKTDKKRKTLRWTVCALHIVRMWISEERRESRISVVWRANKYTTKIFSAQVPFHG